MTVDQLLDMWEVYVTLGGFEGEVQGHFDAMSGRTVDPNTGASTYARPELRAVKLIAYEGGPAYMTIPGSPNSMGLRLSHASHRHPRWYGITVTLLNVYAKSGISAFHVFEETKLDRPDAAVWGMYTHTKQLPYSPGDPAQDAIQINTPDDLYAIKSVTGGAVNYMASILNATATPDFSLSVSGPSSITGGQKVTWTVTLSPRNGFTGSVTPTISGLPAGVTAGAFSPATLVGGGTMTATVVLAAASGAAAGTATATVTGTDPADGLVRTAAQPLAVVQAAAPDFSLSISGPSSVAQGQKVTWTVTLSPINGFTGKVTPAISGLPAGVTAGPFSPSTLTGGGTMTATVALAAASGAAAGTATATVTGTDSADGLVRTAAQALAVVKAAAPDFGIGVSGPSSMNQGDLIAWTVALVPINGFTGKVTPAISGLPAGVTAGPFSPATLVGGSAMTATVALKALDNAAVGTATVTVTGSDAADGLTHGATQSLTVNKKPQQKRRLLVPRRY